MLQKTEETFLTGLSLKIEDGSTHEGSVLDRLVTIRHSGRTALGIYDPSWPISGELVAGQMYELVVVATHFKGFKFPLRPSELGRIGTWQGKVVGVRWAAPEGSYRLARPTLFSKGGRKRAWIVIAMPIGQLLINPAEVRAEIGFEAEAGDTLQWADARYDLYAVR